MARAAYGLAIAVPLAAVAAVAMTAGGNTGAAPLPPPSANSTPVPPSVGAAGETTRRGCDRFAAPRGSDSARGTLADPYRSVRRLARKLRSGQTGCLLPGRYYHREVARLERPGTALRGVGPGRPLVLNPIWIEPRGVGAGIYNIRLTSRDRIYTVPLKVQADRARIVGNTIFGSSNESCVLVGSQNRVHGATIERNVIRRCGRSGKFDHLVYLQNASRTTVRWNVLSGNGGGWAVHLYPNADESIVEHNVIDGNFGGVVIAGYGDVTSDDNLIRANAITFSGPRRNVESSWEGTYGHGNLVTGNCLFSVAADAPSGIGTNWGFTVGPNTQLPGSPYVDRVAGDYRFKPGSRCTGPVGEVAVAVAGRLR